MHSNTPTLPDALANSMRTAVEAARSAASASAHVAASAFIAATDGKGVLHRAWRGEGPDAWCFVTAPGFRAHLLRDTPGTHAQIHFTNLSQQAYESVRAHATKSSECPHDDACECIESPWPTWSDLETAADEPEITDRDGEEIGSARHAFGRAEVTLHEEPAELVYELICLARAPH